MRLSLIVVGLIMVIAVIALYASNLSQRKRVLVNRSKRDVKDIGLSEFPEMEQSVFSTAWIGIANCFGIDPELMDPDDKLDAYVPRHLPELLIDDLERFLEDNGVTQGDVTLQMKVKELVHVIAQKNRC